MLRAHKIRLHPTPEQEVYLRKAAGTARFVYNWALARWKDTHHAGAQGLGPMALKRQFNSLKGEQFPWVYDVAKDVVEGAFFNLAAALKNYKESKDGKRKGEQLGFPKCKSKKRHKPSFCVNNDKFKMEGHHIRIPHLGWVNIAEPLRFQGKIMGAVVSKVADRWYVSITVDVQKPAPVQFAHASVGVDLGVKTLSTLSAGVQYENQAPLRRDLNTLRKRSRALSRRQPGSTRWYKAKHKLVRFHQRIHNKRADIAHKLTTEITRTYHVIGMEDLNIKGMGKNRRLALAIADTSIGEIVRQLTYKADWFGSHIMKVGRFFASSKTCANCEHVNQGLKLADRTWTGGRCGVVHDRDGNASKNIEMEALRLMSIAS